MRIAAGSLHAGAAASFTVQRDSGWQQRRWQQQCGEGKLAGKEQHGLVAHTASRANRASSATQTARGQARAGARAHSMRGHYLHHASPNNRGALCAALAASQAQPSSPTEWLKLRQPLNSFQAGVATHERNHASMQSCNRAIVASRRARYRYSGGADEGCTVDRADTQGSGPTARMALLLADVDAPSCCRDTKLAQRAARPAQAGPGRAGMSTPQSASTTQQRRGWRG